MKFLKFFIPLLLIASNISGNIIYPKVWLSEIYIESPVSWAIELGFADDTSIISFDSIVIETKAGSSRVLEYTLLNPESEEANFLYLAVITNSNLEKTIEIDRENDYIKVYSYFEGWGSYDYLAFGNHPDSYFLDFKEDCSIARNQSWSFSLDNTPTLGEFNSEEGMLGIIEGYIYDSDHNPVANIPTGISNTVISDEDGHYSASVLSRTYFIDTVWVSNTETCIFEPDTFNVFPDSTCQADLLLLSHSEHSSIVLVNRMGPSVFINTPNPFRDHTIFYITLPSIEPNSNITLEIFNPVGQSIASIPLSENRDRYAISFSAIDNMNAGNYYYTLIINGKSCGLINTLVKLP